MKRLLGLGLLLLSVSTVIPAEAAGGCRLRVGWEPWKPYIYQQAGTFHGPEYELLERLAAESGCELEYLERPWARALHELSLGRLDLLYGASRTAEREAFARFSSAYRVEQLQLVVRSGAPAFGSLRDWLEYIPAQRFGLIRGFYYGAQLDPVLRDPQLAERRLEVRSDQQLLQLLQTGRIDAFWVEAFVADGKIAQKGVEVRDLPDLVGEPMHLMFARHVPDTTVERFDQAIVRNLIQAAQRRRLAPSEPLR